jgi:hypothetical protein
MEVVIPNKTENRMAAGRDGQYVQLLLGSLRAYFN